MKKYYLISLKHTNKGDAFISLWRPNNAGYCWYKDWAGVYELDHPIEHLLSTEGILYVEEDVLNSIWIPVLYEDTVRLVILNTPANLNKLQITKSRFRASFPTTGTYRIIDDSFLNNLKLQIKMIEGMLQDVKSLKK